MTSATPSSAVESESPTSTVASCTSASSCAVASASSPAILERKIRPASCTWPMEKGSDEKAEKEIWCTVDENMTSLTSRPYTVGSA